MENPQSPSHPPSIYKHFIAAHCAHGGGILIQNDKENNGIHQRSMFNLASITVMNSYKFTD